MMGAFYQLKEAMFGACLSYKEITLDGRRVLQVKIKDTGYMPGPQDDRDWFLMIEKDGTTWLWDGWISEA